MEGAVKSKTANAMPFYVAPQRLSLQTPCEIIREARAGMMGGREGRGLRPVPTSRPFTPKDRERVLFGAARRGARPPSAVNLSYLQRTETAALKLPSIPTRSSLRAATSHPPPRAVLSLDNLVEEVEGDGVEWRDRGGLGEGELPGLRKSYSSPQERAPSSRQSTPDLPMGHVLRDRWTTESSGLESSLPRQNSEPRIQLKKVHRLQSLPSKGSTDLGQEESTHKVSVETGQKDEILFDDQDQRPTEQIPVIDSSEKPAGGCSTVDVKTKDHNPVPFTEVQDIKSLEVAEEVTKEPGGIESRAQECVTDNSNLTKEMKMVEGEKSTTDEKEGDMIAVLSDGKLVWEASPPRKQPHVEDYVETPTQPRSHAVSGTHLHNLRHNLTQVQGRMNDLHTQIEQLGSRVASGRAQAATNGTFHMNNNKRYHASKTGNNAGSGMKAYRKWSEAAQEDEAEAAKAAPLPRQDAAGWDFFWKNSYFRSKEETLRPELEPLAVVLEELRTMHTKDVNQLDLPGTEVRLEKLYVSLKEVDGFSQGGLPTSFKSKLLQTLYMYADDDRPKLLLLIARLVLALRVESGLPAACKMIFKVARSDVNDHLFLDIPDILELFLDGIGRASPLDAAESCIYGYGALKFLTVNHLLLAHALHLGALDLVTLHLKMANSAQQDGSKVGEQTQHALFQLTGALRNIADGDGIGPLFLTTNCLPALLKTLVLFRADEEIVSNIARTLSTLSSDEDLAQVLLTVDDLTITLVDLLRQYQHSDQIVIRLGYTLGNVLASSDLARVQLSRNESCLPTLLCLLQLYVEKEAGSKEEQETTDDVIVKMVRVVANMSMNPVVGNHLSGLAAQEGQLAAMLRCLVTRKQGAVLLAALGCLNNLSYYVQAHACLLDVTQGVLAVLASRGSIPSQDCVVEACRVLGNLTRHKHTRDLIFTEGGLETLERVLGSGSGSGSVARSVCGVLVNMLLDQETRHAFLQHHGIDKLVSTLEMYPGDWLLAGLVCRAIWNACAPDIALAVQHNDMDQLLTTLANGLEEENWEDGDAEWEEFAGIATDLLERFNAHIESSN